LSGVNAKVLASINSINATHLQAAPALAMGVTFDSMAAAIATQMQNAVSNQQSLQPVTNAAVSVTCALIIKLGGEA